MNESIALLFAAHVFGDFVLQNDWMQRKSSNSWVCTVHVTAYSIPFLALMAVGLLPGWALCLILAEHWLQDRYVLHLKWMTLYGQTPPAKWPVGPLCVDQAWHVAFLGLIGYLTTL